MSEENVVPESTPEATEKTVTEEGVIEESQPPKDAEPDSSTEEDNVVDAVLKELSDEEPEKIPDDPDKETAPEPNTERARADETPKEETPEATEQPQENELYQEPEDLRPKAQERFRSLVEANKFKDQELEESRNVVGEIQKTIQNTGISPEEFSGLLDFARMAVSQSPEEKKQAFQIAKNEMQRLAKEIGIEEGGVDLLDGFQDLQDKVENYELERGDAIELANARRGQQKIVQQQQNATQQQQQSQYAQVTLEQATNDISSFMKGRESTDIDFAAKEKYLMGQVEKIQQKYPPEQWSAVVAQLYDALGTMSLNENQQAKKQTNSPLQPSGQNVGALEPGSMADAILSELRG